LSNGEEYELVLTPPGRRALTDVLPEAVAGAVVEFLTTPLVQQPRRVGKPLRADATPTAALTTRRGDGKSTFAHTPSERPGVVTMRRPWWRR
jgi:mRNA interferase RelE/StbE